MELKDKKLNTNYMLLCQGQFISLLGNAVFDLALGIWILKITGSKTLMASIISVGFIPKIFLGPFAGVICDLYDNKKIIVITDLINGIFITTVSILAIFNICPIWVFFVVSIILGINTCFFNPAVNSLLPIIVKKESIVKCNSFLNFTRVSTDILGSSLGGILIGIVSAPVLFLFNGITFLLSALSEVFIKVHIYDKKKIRQIKFFKDLREGFVYTWNFKGVRSLICIAMILNFFTTMAMTLLIPYFYYSNKLGSSRYGIALSIMTLGMLLGMILLSIVNVDNKNKFKVFCVSGTLFAICFIIGIIIPNYICLLICFLFSGFFHSVMHAFISSSLQLSIESDKRGKVFAIYGTCCDLLKPVGTLLAGNLCELFVKNKIIKV